jgi:hypothetical protein
MVCTYSSYPGMQHYIVRHAPVFILLLFQAPALLLQLVRTAVEFEAQYMYEVIAVCCCTPITLAS